MENSINYLRTLMTFYDTCLSKGALRVTRQSNDIFTLYIDDTKFFHFTNTIATKVKKVCYIFPKTSKINLDGIQKALLTEYDSCLCEVHTNGKYFWIRMVDGSGKCRYKFKGKLFTINMFKIKNKVNKKVKSK